MVTVAARRPAGRARGGATGPRGRGPAGRAAPAAAPRGPGGGGVDGTTRQAPGGPDSTCDGTEDDFEHGTLVPLRRVPAAPRPGPHPGSSTPAGPIRYSTLAPPP